MNIRQIATPVEVRRDAGGAWRHPDLPEGVKEIEEWIKAHNLQTRSITERISAAELGAWEPEAPEGDEWFTLRVGMNGAFASWIWAKKVTP